MTKQLTPTQHLAAIIAAGQIAYEASLPAYVKREEIDPEAIRRRAFLGVLEGIESRSTTPRIVLTLNEERQREICLNCPLADCVGIEQRNCPIRIEQRAEWRRQNKR